MLSFIRHKIFFCDVVLISIQGKLAMILDSFHFAHSPHIVGIEQMNLIILMLIQAQFKHRSVERRGGHYELSA